MQLDFFSWWWAGVPWSRCLHIETYSRPLIVQALKNFWWFFGCQFYVCSFGSYVGMFDVAERMTKICQVNSTEARVPISFKLKSISKVLAWIARTGIIAERWHMLFLHFASNFCFLNWNQFLYIRSKFPTKYCWNIHFFSEKMKRKNLPFLEGMIFGSHEAHRWNVFGYTIRPLEHP